MYYEDDSFFHGALLLTMFTLISSAAFAATTGIGGIAKGVIKFVSGHTNSNTSILAEVDDILEEGIEEVVNLI